MSNTFKEISTLYKDLEEIDEWLADAGELENKFARPRKIRPDEADVLQKRKRVSNDKYLKDFVKMQEYKWQSKFRAAQADRLRKRLKNRGAANMFS